MGQKKRTARSYERDLARHKRCIIRLVEVLYDHDCEVYYDWMSLVQNGRVDLVVNQLGCKPGERHAANR